MNTDNPDLTANYNAPFCVDCVMCPHFFGLGMILQQILTNNLSFTFEYIFHINKCYSFLLTHLFLVFLMSIFDVRRYDSAYLNYYNRFPPNEIAQSVESAYLNYYNRFPPNEVAQSVKKKNQFGVNMGILKSYLELGRKRMFEEKNMFLRYHQKFSSKKLCPLMHLKYAFYICSFVFL